MGLDKTLKNRKQKASENAGPIQNQILIKNQIKSKPNLNATSFFSAPLFDIPIRFLNVIGSWIILKPHSIDLQVVKIPVVGSLTP